ncbi:MAG: APC family permease [Alphaproteobacteria bacterium]|nr:MAG: APC family permease [Alphaproteobacteria bacterium]
MTEKTVEKAQLKRHVGLTGVVMFGAGTAIGVSIFSVLAPAAEVGGAGLLLAAVLAAVPMVFFAVAYAWLASALPKSGASYEWPRRFIHPFVGFVISWMRILSNVGAMTVLATVLVNYLGRAVELPVKPTMALVLTAIFALNYIGVRMVARAQTILMIVLLFVFAIFVGTGLPAADTDHVGPLLAMGWPAVFAAVPLMISLFLGIESAVEIGEEVKDPQRTIPRGISLAILLTLVVYLLVAATALLLLGPEKLAASAAPLLDAARVPLGDYAVPLIVGAAAVSILKTLNSTALMFSRALYAMGRTGVFSPVLGRIHPRFGTPHMAILLAYACAMSGLLLPSSLVFLLLAVNIPTMLKYMACSFCAVRIVDRHKDVAARAELKLSHRTVRLVGHLGMLAAALIIVAGIEADWRPYALVVGWALVGCIYWIVRKPAPVTADD